MSATLMARLSKKEDRVLCGRINCGADIAVLVECSTIFGEEFSVLCFPSGWSQRDDGVWVLSRHAISARKKAMRGKRPFPSRALSRRGHELGEYGKLLHALKRPDVPALAICPTCGFMQTLDAEELGSIDPRSRLPEVEVDWPRRWAEWTLEVCKGDW